MKKEYFKPEILVINVNTTQTIMTSSTDIQDGNPSSNFILE